MRAAFKAVMDGKQVAVLAPTTVLAFPARQDAARSVCRVSRDDRHGQPLPHEAGNEGDPRRRRLRQGRHHRRHASPAVEGRRVQGSRPAGRRRGTAVRRRAQGAHQADAQAGRRADDDRDADSADAEHVARGHPRHVDHRDAAEGSAVDPDQRREVRRAGDRAGGQERAGARRPDLLRPQPRRIDLLDRQPAPAARARSQDRHRPRTDGGRRARERDARIRGAAVRHPAGDDDRRERPRHSRTPTRSSSTARTGTACRSSISCAAASAGPIVRRTPTC